MIVRDGVINTLLAGVVGYVLKEAVLPPPLPTCDWRDWLREMFHRFRQQVRQHPSIAPLIGTQLLSNSGVAAGMTE